MLGEKVCQSAPFEKIPQDIADSLCSFHQLSAVRHRKVAGATSCLEISRSSVGVLGEESHALAAGGLSGQTMPLSLNFGLMTPFF